MKFLNSYKESPEYMSYIEVMAWPNVHVVA